jgi:uncharacterized protein (DUF1800 family)
MTSDTFVPVKPSVVSPLALIGLGVLAVAQSGCKSESSSESSTNEVPEVPPESVTATIDSIGLRDAAGNPLTVDGVVGTAEGVLFKLDNGNTATSRAADSGIAGAAQDYSFLASSTSGSATVDITINPSPGEVISARSFYPDRARKIRIGKTISAMGFSPTFDQLTKYQNLSHAQLVQKMVDEIDSRPIHYSLPDWINAEAWSASTAKWYKNNNYTKWEEHQAGQIAKSAELRRLFLKSMIRNPSSLTERLLLFWHNLFTTSMDEIARAEHAARQHRLYRQHIAGNLGTFLKAMYKDPAMILYLDNWDNQKEGPNENFARELLELFTFGERTKTEAYAESDVPIVAKCFTGHGLKLVGNTYSFYDNQHDLSVKKLWGSTSENNTKENGKNEADWVIDLILAKKDKFGNHYCALHIVKRLWKEFIDEDTDKYTTRIEALARNFSLPNDDEHPKRYYHLPTLYAALFKEPAFTERIGKRIRSPVELYVNYYRALGIIPSDEELDEVMGQLQSLDQHLFNPFNVLGWPTGKDWVNVKNFIYRTQYMRWLGTKHQASITKKYPKVSDLEVIDILLGTSWTPIISPSSTDSGERAFQYITDPTYNLR